jgi:hypothetical protein
MPDFTNQSGWQVQQNSSNLESGGSAFSSIHGGIPNSLIAQTFDPVLANASAPIATGTLVGVLTLITEPVKTSKVKFASVSATTTFAAACIVDLKGNILAKTADVHADWAANTELPAEAWATAAILAPGLYYFAVAAVGTTPTVSGVIANAVSGNVNSTAAAGNLRCATLATGITNALPAGPLTLTSATAVASAPWIGIL